MRNEIMVRSLYACEMEESRNLKSFEIFFLKVNNQKKKKDRVIVRR